MLKVFAAVAEHGSPGEALGRAQALVDAESGTFLLQVSDYATRLARRDDLDDRESFFPRARLLLEAA
jgi:hypothetical protein